MSGYELKKRFASSLGYGWRAYDTQIYRELKGLEQTGLVEGSLTEPGRDALQAWLQSPLDDTWHKSELTLRIWSMHLIAPDDLEQMLGGVEAATQAYVHELQERRAELRERFGPLEIAEDPHGVGHQLILEFDMQVAELKLAWIDRVRAVSRIRSLLEERARQSQPQRSLQSDSGRAVG